MISYLSAFVFGLVQGIGEFLPISSSGHLILLHRFLSLPVKNEIAFDVALHLATFLALFCFFYRDIWRIFLAWLKSISGEKSPDSRLAWRIAIATVPAAFCGIFFEDLIENVLRSPLVVIVMLVLVGGLFILIEKASKKTLTLAELGWCKPFLIGLAQALALIPGTSRSGITIIAGLGAGLKREEALRFSFLISLPIVFGAGAKELPALFFGNFASNELAIILIAFLSAFLSGWFAIFFLLRFVKNHSLSVFAWYRFVLAALALILLYA